MTKTQNLSGLPHGSGSIQQRGAVYWLIYRNADGRVIQTNAKTTVFEEAQLKLAEEALQIMFLKVQRLMEFVNETKQNLLDSSVAADGKASTRTRSKQRTSSKPVPTNAAKRKVGEGARATRKGAQR